MTGEPAIEVEGVWFSYDGSPVLEDVNLSIARGDFVSVVGPNGGGKTTLLKLVLGLLQPTRGRIRVFGGSSQESRHRIGYTPQHARLDPQFPATVMDVVLMGRLGNGWNIGPYSRGDKRAAVNSLEQVGLGELGGRPFSSLSGGQRQRLLIARALAGDPEMLLMDEPTAHLDLAAEGEFYELLRALNERMTIVMVSHDLHFVSAFVRSVVCVKRQVKTHTTSDLSGEVMKVLHGTPMKLVRHDHDDTGVIRKCLSS